MFFIKRADVEKMKAFWLWFEENEEWIISSYKTESLAIVNAIDEQLSPVFASYPIEIEFELGYHDGCGEFFFFDLRKRSLKKDAERLASLMPVQLRERWVFIIEH